MTLSQPNVPVALMADPTSAFIMGSRNPANPLGRVAADGQIAADFLAVFSPPLPVQRPEIAQEMPGGDPPDAAVNDGKAIPAGQDGTLAQKPIKSPYHTEALPFWAIAIEPTPNAQISVSSPLPDAESGEENATEFAENAENAMHLFLMADGPGTGDAVTDPAPRAAHMPTDPLAFWPVSSGQVMPPIDTVTAEPAPPSNALQAAVLPADSDTWLHALPTPNRNSTASALPESPTHPMPPHSEMASKGPLDPSLNGVSSLPEHSVSHAHERPVSAFVRPALGQQDLSQPRPAGALPSGRPSDTPSVVAPNPQTQSASEWPLAAEGTLPQPTARPAIMVPVAQSRTGSADDPAIHGTQPILVAIAKPDLPPPSIGAAPQTLAQPAAPSPLAIPASPMIVPLPMTAHSGADPALRSAEPPLPNRRPNIRETVVSHGTMASTPPIPTKGVRVDPAPTTSQPPTVGATAAPMPIIGKAPPKPLLDPLPVPPSFPIPIGQTDHSIPAADPPLAAGAIRPLQAASMQTAPLPLHAPAALGTAAPPAEKVPEFVFGTMTADFSVTDRPLPRVDTVIGKAASAQHLPIPTPLPDLVTRQILPNIGNPGSVSVTLSPIELGTLRFEVTPRGDGLHLHLTVDAPATLDLLRRQGDQILAELRQAGFAQTSLSFAPGGGQTGGDQSGSDARDGGSSPPATTALQADPAPILRRPTQGIGLLDIRL